jgi:hypothetical protein
MDETNRITAFLTMVAILLFMVLARVYIGSASEYRRAVEAQEIGDLISAVNHYGHSIKWYAPLSPWVKRSLGELWEIGEDSYEQGDLDTAIFAVTTLRSSLYSSRGPFTPFKGHIEMADDWLSSHVPEGYPDVKAEDLSRSLKAPKPPNRAWSLSAGIGVVGWILSVFAFIFTVFPDGKGKFWLRKALGIGFFVVAFYALWVLGIYFS